MHTNIHYKRPNGTKPDKIFAIQQTLLLVCSAKMWLSGDGRQDTETACRVGYEGQPLQGCSALLVCFPRTAYGVIHGLSRWDKSVGYRMVSLLFTALVWADLIAREWKCDANPENHQLCKIQWR